MEHIDIKRLWCHTEIYKLLHPWLRMWTMPKPFNNSIFLQGLGTTKQIFLFVLVMGKKKISFKTATVLSVLSVTRWYSKMEFSKEESRYQSGCLADVPVKSPQKSREHWLLDIAP